MPTTGPAANDPTAAIKTLPGHAISTVLPSFAEARNELALGGNWGRKVSLDEGLSRLIGDIYLASEGGASWDTISAEILGQTKACAGLRTVVNLETGEMADFRFFGAETSGAADAFLEYPDLKENDPSLRWAIKNPWAGFCASDAILQREDYLSNPWVKWNKARFGATHWYVCYSPPVGGLSHSLSIQIPAHQGAATVAQIAKLQMLFSHLDAATRLQRMHQEAVWGNLWLVLDRSARVIGMSRDAEQTLAQGDGLSVRAEHLQTSCPAIQQQLEHCLERVAATLETGCRPAALWIDRPNGRSPWLLIVKPHINHFIGLPPVVSGFYLHLAERGSLLGRGSSPMHLFDLSPREAEVLDLLSRGHSLESLAQVLGISVNTAKVHLHAVFRKTRTHRQAELLQLCTQIQIH